MNLLTSCVIAFVLLTTVVPIGSTQIEVGAEITSRYIWQGHEFGNSPSLQPSLFFTAGGFAAGTWGTFATSGDSNTTEVDFWVSYSTNTRVGTLSIVATDDTFPIHHTGLTGLQPWFHRNAHFVAVGIGYEGEGSFPLSFFAGMFDHNDEDNSVYIGVGYDTGPLDSFIGMTPTASSVSRTSVAGVLSAGCGQVESLISPVHLPSEQTPPFILTRMPKPYALSSAYNEPEEFSIP